MSALMPLPTILMTLGCWRPDSRREPRRHHRRQPLTPLPAPLRQPLR